MDYSAANVSLWSVIIQLGLIAAAILAAGFLRSKLAFVRRSMMPVAVLAGFLLLIIKQTGLITFNGVILETLVYHGIALGFIAMSLRVPGKDRERAEKLTGLKSGALIVSTYLVQGVVGLIITIGLALTVKPDMFRAAGLLLPMGYGQGPGQANNIGASYEAMGFRGGHSFGLAIAAAGYLCACIVGVVMVNVLARRRKNAAGQAGTDEKLTVDYFQDTNEIPVSDSVDKLSVQLALIFVVYLLTYLVTRGLTSGISAVSEGLANTLNALLWGFNFIVGSALATLVRFLLGKAKKARVVVHQYQNNYLLNRISGFFFDVMIVAGIAAINLEDLTGLWLPFALLAVAGAAVTWVYLAIVCRRIYGDYYDEGLISMYGMLTGTISSGVLLLREIDPELKTPAANNLITGSSFGILFGAPVLVLITMAARSDTMCFVTLGLAAAYLALLLVLIYRLGRKKRA
jgi:ESS family glutamate:Na+ symporter